MARSPGYQHFPGMVLALDEMGQILDVSQSWLTRLGYRRKQVLGYHWSEFIAAPNQDLAGALLVRCQAGQQCQLQTGCLAFLTAAGDRVLLDLAVNRHPAPAPAPFVMLLTEAPIPNTTDPPQISEPNLRQLIEHIPQIVWVADATTYQVLYINPAFETIYGRSRQAVYENPDCFLASVHPEDCDRIQAALQAERQHSIPFQEEYRIIRSDGTLRWIRDLSFPLAGQGFQSRQIIGLSEDITERKQAEQQRQQEQEFLQTVLETTSNLIFVKNQQERYLLANQAMANLYHTTPAGLQGKCDEDFHPFSQETLQFARENHQVITSGQPLYIPEQPMSQTSGEPLWFEWHKYPLRLPGSQEVCVLGIGNDVTRRHQTEVALQQLNAELEARVQQRTTQLEAANQELESFSYSVSHDLRAPLRHISGFITLLSKHLQSSGGLDDTTDHYLEIIQKSAHKMEQLIEGLLLLSRVGRRELRPQQVNLNTLVERAIALISPPGQTAPHDPVVFTVAELPTVEGDASLLQQVFSNLIDNAVKFSQHCRPAQIEIGTLPDGVIYIQDNGVGFSMEHADRLFSPFERLHSSTEFSGTGIGLALVNRIIKRHGGTLWVESEPGCGTTFFFQLP